MNKLPAAKNLSDAEYRFLLKVFADHNRSMGIEERKHYSLTDIVKVKKNFKENCFEVYYSNGEWFHYFPNGTWC